MTTPRWERVAEAIRTQIRTGTGLDERADGRYLSSYPRLIEQHQVSYGTIRTAILQLKAEGWIEGDPGVGLRVREDHP